MFHLRRADSDGGFVLWKTPQGCDKAYQPGGGQIVLPLRGSMWLPSRYGDKYRRGLVQGPASQVFVSCGVGTAGLPFRINCPPEINLLTLVAAG